MSLPVPALSSPVNSSAPRAVKNIKRRRGWLTCAATIGVLLGCLAIAAAPARAQITSRQLLDSSVSDFGPQYKEVDDAITRFRNRDFEGARQLLQIAKTKNPQLPPGDVLLAQLFLVANDGDAARVLFEQVVNDDPTDPEAYLFLGELGVRQGLLAEADLLFGKAGELNAKFDRNPKRKIKMQIRVLAGQAVVAETRRKWEAAEKLIGEWIKLDSDNAAPYARLAQSLFQQKKYKEAYAALGQAAQKNPELGLPEVNLGLMYEQASGQTTDDKEVSDLRSQALKFMQLGLSKAAAKDVKTRQSVAQWAIDTGHLDIAKTCLDEIVKLEPEGMSTKLLQGVLARTAKDYAMAEKAFGAAHVLSPASALPVNQLALVLIESNDEAKKKLAAEYALLNARLFTDLKTNDAREALLTLAWIQFRSGNEAVAEQNVVKALRPPTQQGQIPGQLTLAGLSPDGLYYAAKIIADRGQPDIARQVNDYNLRLNRSFPSREDALALKKKLGDSPKKDEAPKK